MRNNMKKEIKTKLSPPWITYISELKAMFGEDPDIEIKYNGSDIVKLYVKDKNKATAMYLTMRENVNFGNIELNIDIIPPNEEFGKFSLKDNDIIYNAMFKNNPVFSFVHKVEGIYGFNATYVVFKNKVVQYFNDNLNDIYGNTSTLYEDIARDIFENNIPVNNNVFYCTDVTDNKLKNVNWP